MPNYFYFDANGQKHGLVNEQQLQALAAQGKITPNTPLETDDGHQGLAGQIPGLNFNTTAQPSFTQTVPKRKEPQRQSAAYPQTNESPGTPWLTDFSFQNIRLLQNGRRVCSFIYTCCVITLAINGLIVFFMFDPMYSAETMTAAIMFLVFYLISAYIFLVLVRVGCEFLLVLLDYISKK